MYIYVSVCMCVYIYKTPVHSCQHKYTYTYMHINVYIWKRMYICMCIYIYIHTHNTYMCIYTYMHAYVLNCFGHVQLCATLPCSSPGSSVHAILQARILDWIATPFSMGSSQLRDRIQVSCTRGRFFTREAEDGASQ